MHKKDLAIACFKSGYNCSQSVISIFGPELGLEAQLAYRVAGAFGGGMGRRGETCGAVTGAFMVIGLKHAAVDGSDKAARDKAYGVLNDFAERFEARNGTLRCNDLLGVDISTAAGREHAHQEGRFDKLCPKYVGDAVEILEEILTE
jgi:C_GCAxxG_C_C family probable redox protein